MFIAWLCFIVAAILLTIEMVVARAVSLGSVAMVLLALGLAFTTWPSGLGT